LSEYAKASNSFVDMLLYCAKSAIWALPAVALANAELIAADSLGRSVVEANDAMSAMLG